MTRDQLEHAIRAACDVADDTEVWVFGSQAILGEFPDAPEDLRTSIEVDNRYDGNKPNPHPHVICIKCKKIVNPDLDNLDEMKKEVELETNFKILNHRLDFFGICSNCMAEKV